MNAELKAMIDAQHDVHGRMSRSVDNLRKLGATNITHSVVQTRISILDNLWGQDRSPARAHSRGSKGKI